MPQPPLLPEGGREPDCALLLAQAHNAAVTRYYGGPPRLPTEVRQLVGHKSYPTLINAIDQIREYKIAPHAWCEFSLWFWSGSKSKTGSRHNRYAPSAQWVYSLKRLKERNDLYVWQEARTRGGVMLYRQEHRKLVDLYERMQAAVITHVELHPNCTATEIEQLVERHYPARLRKRLFAQAEDNAEADEYEIKTRLKRGEYIW